MKIFWHLPLPGPFSVGGRVRLTPRRTPREHPPATYQPREPISAPRISKMPLISPEELTILAEMRTKALQKETSVTGISTETHLLLLSLKELPAASISDWIYAPEFSVASRAVVLAARDILDPEFHTMISRREVSWYLIACAMRSQGRKERKAAKHEASKVAQKARQNTKRPLD